jgi:recombinational DNA repair protein RecT
MPAPNQTEKEFFALVATGRRGVEDMLATMGGEMRAIAAPNVAQAFDTWTKRALVEVTTNENLRPVIQSRDGIHSVYSALSKAATLGLQIGGSFPHAYLTPKSGRAVLMPSQDGYIFACTFGPGAVLALPPDLHEVYEKDEFAVDEAAATYEHKFAPFGDRGKLVGFFTVLEFRDGRRMIRHVTIDEVKAIETGYGTTNSPAYQKSLIDMHRKTAMKKMLKPIVKICEGLAMLMSLDEYAEPVQAATPPRDVTERTSARLDKAVGTFDAEVIPEKAAAVEGYAELPNQEPKQAELGDDKTDIDIF